MTQATKFWRQNRQVGQIADLREEATKMILGSGGFEGIGQNLVLRRMSRTGERCPCWDEVKGSSSDCKYCEGEPYQWSEDYVRGHFTQSYGRALSAAFGVHRLEPEGIFDRDRALIYLTYDADVKTGDTMFRIRTNEDGATYYPVQRIEKWRVVHAEDRREERGRIAFYICLCERVEVG